MAVITDPNTQNLNSADPQIRALGQQIAQLPASVQQQVFTSSGLLGLSDNWKTILAQYGIQVPSGYALIGGTIQKAGTLGDFYKGAAETIGGTVLTGGVANLIAGGANVAAQSSPGTGETSDPGYSDDAGPIDPTESAGPTDPGATSPTTPGTTPNAPTTPSTSSRSSLTNPSLWGQLAGSAGSLAGSIIAANASGNATDAQAAAAQKALDFEEGVYNDRKTALTPFVTAGSGAAAKMSNLIGVPVTPPTAATPVTPTPATASTSPTSAAPASNLLGTASSIEDSGPLVTVVAPTGQTKQVSQAAAAYYQTLPGVQIIQPPAGAA